MIKRQEEELEEVPTSNDSLSEMSRGGGGLCMSWDRGYIEQCSGFRGVSKAGKAREKPAKGGFGNVGSTQIGGLFKKRVQAYAYPK